MTAVLIVALGKIHETHQSNDAWEDRLGWFKSSPEYRNFDRIDGEPMEFEWNIFPRFNTLQLSEEVKRLLLRLNETPENFTRRIIFMSMFNDISCGSEDNEQECLANAKLVLVPKRSGTVSAKTVHKEYGTIWRKRCVPRLHCPEVNSKVKDMENCRYTMQPIWKRLRLFFA